MIRSVSPFAAEHIARNLDPRTLAEFRVGTGQDDETIRQGIIAGAFASPFSFCIWGPCNLPALLVTFVPMAARHLGINFLTTPDASVPILRDAFEGLWAFSANRADPYISAEILIPAGDFAGAHRMATTYAASAHTLTGACADGSDLIRYTFERS